MSGFKITEPDGSVYDHGDATHTKNAGFAEAQKIACAEVAQAFSQYEASVKNLDTHIACFLGHRQAFNQKLATLRKRKDKLYADYQQKKRQLAELDCILEPHERH
jgi:chromosome segregation ATPase